ncbi:type I methionyl aminopeptidase [Candidatus Kaiserbacteria bacterium CG10_big_fil_rev_8_21_14_0_10_45_20]|uniref:Methionine aminopeptidase n=1 Tax=Candidatus Kaiserbacteria bacterium CG10_big_fil_rev_8_21_14_0_10_45_20 TaxID=1974607 RepID=A0A2H0UFN7_9BACT|nr:MAG: type I methionyl aminopeptidase [Candidatus Kaiserbacteria bacterium CG10_big_fil_rev_8_21_14_0_10_45_20]
MIIQTEEERAILREGGKHLASILKTLESELKPGMNTRDINLRAEALIAQYGDTPALKGYHPQFAERAYPSSICVSVNDEVVHGIPSENNIVLQDGDIVSLDLVIIHNGLFVDSALTAPVGEIDSATKRLLSATEEALLLGIRQARTGARMGDISSAIENKGYECGYGVVYDYGGHGVGNAVHEEPSVPNVGDPGRGIVLREGMVLAIEPMFNEGSPEVVLEPDGYTIKTADGKRSAHFEHTIIVGKDGAEILTLRD